jgi:hypothetical protein
MRQARHNHKAECVSPERREQDQAVGHIIDHLVCGILDGEAANDEGSRLPSRAHDQDPAERSVVHCRLEDVVDRGESKEDGKEDGGANGGTICELVLWVIDRCFKGSSFREQKSRSRN